jgi:hypothetical protein
MTISRQPGAMELDVVAFVKVDSTSQTCGLLDIQ